MDEKRVSRTGWLYLVIMELFIVANIVRLLVGERGEMNVFLTVMTSQGMMILPVIVYFLIIKTGFKETFSVRAVRFTTLLLMFLYVIMWYPLIAACNAFTMVFTENAAVALNSEFEGVNPFVVWLVAGVIGPLLEEFSFRGAILSGLKKSGKIFAAVLLQALMFGILHLNLNQMAYASVMGFAYGMAVSVTGSVWCGFLGHMLMNSVSIIAMQVLSSMPGNMLEQSAQMTNDPAMKNMMLAMVPMLLVIGLISAGLSMFLLKAMASVEGREDEFKKLFSRGDRSEPGTGVLSIPAALGLLLGIIFIVIRLLTGH